MREALEGLAGVAARLGEAGVEDDARELARRIAAGRFFVAAVGQFKRGKSTLINALIGQPLLPVGVVPVTSAITIIAHGDHPTACVRFAGGAFGAISLPDLALYVTEEANPENACGVRVVEVSIPAPVLERGLCLVDTPGIGSVFGGNSAATREFVPHIDAALVVLGADPPVSGDELTLIDEVARETADLVVVLNKADRLPSADREQAAEFTRRVLETRLGRSIGRIYHVSATAALAGARDAEWDALCGRVQHLASNRETVLAGRGATRARALRLRLVGALDERERALAQPLEDTERRIGQLKVAVLAAERSLRDLGPLLSAEQAAMARALDGEKARLVQRLCEEGVADLAARAPALGTGLDAGRPALDLARSIAHQQIAAAAPDIEQDTAALYQRSMQRFTELVEDFLLRAAGTGGPVFGHLPGSVQLELTTAAHFYFTEMLTLSSPGTSVRLLDLVTPPGARRRRAEARACGYLERLVETNLSRFVNDLIERLAQSRARLESEIRRVLTDVVRRADDALDAARRARAAGEAAVVAERRCLDEARQALAALDVG